MVIKRVESIVNKMGRDTSVATRLAYFIWVSFKRSQAALLRLGYNSSTIAKYFREQGAHVGEDCDIQVRSLGPDPYLVSIGNHVFISPGVAFHTHDGGVWVLRDKVPGIRVYGPIVIEDNCIIGVNVMLFGNVRIGRNSIVGAGSVVITDVPPNSIVMGVPARAISSVQKYEERCLARWNEQKPPGLETGADYGWWRDKKNRQNLRKHLTALFKEQLDQQKPPAD
jgi:acetyltransferase-like isoleucine patch superfamily enzyme